MSTDPQSRGPARLYVGGSEEHSKVSPGRRLRAPLAWTTWWEDGVAGGRESQQHEMGEQAEALHPDLQSS